MVTQYCEELNREIYYQHLEGGCHGDTKPSNYCRRKVRQKAGKTSNRSTNRYYLY